LQRYVLDSYSARKLKMKTTGNAGGVHNLVVKVSDFDLSELLRKMDTGLLITEFMGDGVNIVTGDYSRGIFGYWIENGLIQYPVTGATIAGNLKDMLLNIVAISNDIDYRSNILTGSILLDKMTIAGT
jgi:PmbA protein